MDIAIVRRFMFTFSFESIHSIYTVLLYTSNEVPDKYHNIVIKHHW